MSGQITRKEIIEDEALYWGKEYEKTIQLAISKNKEFVEGIINLKVANDKLRASEDKREYIENLRKVDIESKKTIASIKEQFTLESSLEKIKKEKIQTSKTELDLDVKKAKAAKELSSLMAVEERLSQEKLKTEKEIILVEKQLTDLEIKKQQLKTAGLSASKSELDLIQKEDAIKRNKLALLDQESAKIRKQQEDSKQNIIVWKEQNQLELALVSTKRKNELATESTNRSLTKERVLLAETNKEVKQQARESLGLVGTYEKLNKARNESQKRLADLLSAEIKNRKEIKLAIREFNSLDSQVKKVDATTKIYTKSIGNYSSAFKGMSSIFRDALSAFGIVGGISMFAQIAKDIFQETKELQSLDLALQQVTGTSEKFLQTQVFLNRISEQYGVGIKELTKSFTQFYVSAKDKISGKEIEGIFESISKAAGFMGLSVDQQEGAFLALTQMLSKGTIQAEELRGQLSERLPGAFGILAKSMGVTEIELNKLLKDGKVLAAEVLPKFAKELEKAYGIDQKNRVESLTASQTRLSNSWTDFVRSLNESETGGISSFFRTIIDGATDFLNAIKLINKENTFNSNFKEKTDAGVVVISDVIKKLEEEKKSQADILEIVRLKQKNAFENRSNIEWELNALKEQEKQVVKTINGIKLNILGLPSIGNTFKLDAAKRELKETRERLAEVGKEYGFYNGIVKGSNEYIKGLNKETAQNSIQLTEAELKKRKAEYEKYLKEMYDLRKKEADDDFKLRQYRLQTAMKEEDKITDNLKNSFDDRIEALLFYGQLSTAKIKENTEYELQQLGKYNAEKGVFVRKFSDLEIQNLLENGKRKSDLTSEEKEIYERYQNDITESARKGEEDRRKIIDSEVEANKKLIDSKLQEQTNKQNEEIIGANNIYTQELEAAGDNFKLIEAAREKHEKAIQEIQKRYALENVNAQINQIEEILKAQEALPENERLSADLIKKYQDDLLDFKTQASNLAVENNRKNADITVEQQKELNEKLIDLGLNLKDALTDLTNAIFDARIANIDAEIERNNEYYDGEIEKAGENERQKKLLEEERAKKNEELEKKRKKEAYKAAVFNKVMALTNIAIQTAMASIAALAPPPIGLGPVFGLSLLPLIIGTGAVQAATVLAAPLPKYKMGRNDGPDEFAVVGDGGRREVVSDPDGSNPVITPNKPTITFLRRKQKVHRSVEDYKKYMRDSFLSDMEVNHQKAKEFQANINVNNDNKDLLEEMRLTRKAFEKMKTNVTVNVPKNDLNHDLFRFKNTNW